MDAQLKSGNIPVLTRGAYLRELFGDDEVLWPHPYSMDATETAESENARLDSDSVGTPPFPIRRSSEG